MFSANWIPKLQHISQDDAEFTFSPRSWKWANITPWESQNTVSITFPADYVTLNFLVEDEMESFHCTETRFDLGW
jgi:hypothetical protein